MKASAVSQSSVRDEFDHAGQHCLDRPYNRNDAQKPVKRCKSSNFGMACDYTASGLTFAASDLPQFTNSYYSVEDPQHRVAYNAFLPYRIDARCSVPSVGNATAIVHRVASYESQGSTVGRAVGIWHSSAWQHVSGNFRG